MALLFDEKMSELEQECCFGLDFGTFRSLMSYKLPDSRSPQPATARGIASLFWHPADSPEYRALPDELLCEDVLRNDGLAADPKGVVTSIKMKLDQPVLQLHGKQYTPDYVAAAELRYILEASSRAMVEEMVLESSQEPWVGKRMGVGIPVVFGTLQRQMLLNILKKEAPGAKIRLLPEPMAAAIYYKQMLQNRMEKVVVYDLGAGTFDSCALVPNTAPSDAEPYPYRALHPAGFAQAGDELDRLMEELMLDKLRAQPQDVRLEVLLDENHRDRRALRKTAQEAKEALSSCEQVSKVVSGLECGSATLIITRQEYEQRIQPLLEKTVSCTEQVIRESGLWGDSDVHLLMVGGGSYVPLVSQLLRRRFASWLPAEHIVQRKPEQAIALGCAIYAEKQQFVPKSAFGYAVDTHRGSNGAHILHVRIPSNASLPYSVRAVYSTRFANQSAIRFGVYEIPNAKEGDQLDFDDTAKVSLELVHRFGRKVPADTPVELTTTLNSDGILTLTIDDHISGKPTTKTLNASSHTY